MIYVLVRDPERLKGEGEKEEGAVGPGGLRGEGAKLLSEETVVRWERGWKVPLLDELKGRSGVAGVKSRGELDEEASS